MRVLDFISRWIVRYENWRMERDLRKILSPEEVGVIMPLMDCKGIAVIKKATKGELEY